MDKKLAGLMSAMIEYDKGDPRRIQHLIKVHDLAATIGTLEKMPAEDLYVLEAAAILHDIGIHKCEEKYQSTAGNYQEIEGPEEAERLLCRTGTFTSAQINRIKYLIAHHHTYNDIKELDYQILVEADFMVNLYEEGSSPNTAKMVMKNIFKTPTGIKLISNMFGIK